MLGHLARISQRRKQGLQVATIDARLAQLCIRHDLVMLTADKAASLSLSSTMPAMRPGAMLLVDAVL